jgi:putative ABC transport system permease protein
MNFLTELREGLAISWSAIRANKLRSFLTTLGIIIGVVTVTLMATAIEGLNRSLTESLATIGADVLFVDKWNWLNSSAQEWLEQRKRPPLTIADAETLKRSMTQAIAVAPVAMDNEPVRYKKNAANGVQIVGTSDEYQMTAGITMAEGRFFSSAEGSGGRPVCVLGSDIATNLFHDAPPIGEKIFVGNSAFTVLGVVEKQGGIGDSGADNNVIFPLNQFVAAFWDNPDYNIQVKVKDIKHLDDAKEELRVILRRARHLKPGEPDNFSINQQEQFLEFFHKLTGTIGTVGLFVTGLALFVGGIGIMNIMFVSVAERTREIGVRKAIGAKRRTILLQFLTEAACICLLGGLIALMIAWPITLLMHRFMPATLSPLIVGGALLVSAATGILSGFMPAWRAARMNPVDALRNE